MRLFCEHWLTGGCLRNFEISIRYHTCKKVASRYIYSVASIIISFEHYEQFIAWTPNQKENVLGLFKPFVSSIFDIF